MLGAVRWCPFVPSCNYMLGLDPWYTSVYLFIFNCQEPAKSFVAQWYNLFSFIRRIRIRISPSQLLWLLNYPPQKTKKCQEHFSSLHNVTQGTVKFTIVIFETKLCPGLLQPTLSSIKACCYSPSSNFVSITCSFYHILAALLNAWKYNSWVYLKVVNQLLKPGPPQKRGLQNFFPFHLLVFLVLKLSQ